MCKFIFDATILISDNVDHAEKVPQKSREFEECIVLYLRHCEREISKKYQSMPFVVICLNTKTMQPMSGCQLGIAPPIFTWHRVYQLGHGLV